MSINTHIGEFHIPLYHQGGQLYRIQTPIHPKPTCPSSNTMARPYDKPITDIAHYVHHYQIQDQAALKSARVALLDAMGCAIETASKSEECQKLLGPPISGTTVPDGFRVPGTKHQMDPVKGAFDLGVLIRYLDHNDALGGAEWGHPSGIRPSFRDLGS